MIKHIAHLTLCTIALASFSANALENAHRSCATCPKNAPCGHVTENYLTGIDLSSTSKRAICPTCAQAKVAACPTGGCKIVHCQECKEQAKK